VALVSAGLVAAQVFGIPNGVPSSMTSSTEVKTDELQAKLLPTPEQEEVKKIVQEMQVAKSAEPKPMESASQVVAAVTAPEVAKVAPTTAEAAPVVPEVAKAAPIIPATTKEALVVTDLAKETPASPEATKDAPKVAKDATPAIPESAKDTSKLAADTPAAPKAADPLSTTLVEIKTEPPKPDSPPSAVVAEAEKPKVDLMSPLESFLKKMDPTASESVVKAAPADKPAPVVVAEATPAATKVVDAPKPTIDVVTGTAVEKAAVPTVAADGKDPIVVPSAPLDAAAAPKAAATTTADSMRLALESMAAADKPQVPLPAIAALGAAPLAAAAGGAALATAATAATGATPKIEAAGGGAQVVVEKVVESKAADAAKSEKVTEPVKPDAAGEPTKAKEDVKFSASVDEPVKPKEEAKPKEEIKTSAPGDEPVKAKEGIKVFTPVEEPAKPKDDLKLSTPADESSKPKDDLKLSTPADESAKAKDDLKSAPADEPAKAKDDVKLSALADESTKPKDDVKLSANVDGSEKPKDDVPQKAKEGAKLSAPAGDLPKSEKMPEDLREKVVASESTATVDTPIKKLEATADTTSPATKATASTEEKVASPEATAAAPTKDKAPKPSDSEAASPFDALLRKLEVTGESVGKIETPADPVLTAKPSLEVQTPEKPIEPVAAVEAPKAAAPAAEKPAAGAPIVENPAEPKAALVTEPPVKPSVSVPEKTTEPPVIVTPKAQDTILSTKEEKVEPATTPKIDAVAVNPKVEVAPTVVTKDAATTFLDFVTQQGKSVVEVSPTPSFDLSPTVLQTAGAVGALGLVAVGIAATSGGSAGSSSSTTMPPGTKKKDATYLDGLTRSTASKSSKKVEPASYLETLKASSSSAMKPKAGTPVGNSYVESLKKTASSSLTPKGGAPVGTGSSYMESLTKAKPIAFQTKPTPGQQESRPTFGFAPGAATQSQTQARVPEPPKTLPPLVPKMDPPQQTSPTAINGADNRNMSPPSSTFGSPGMSYLESVSSQSKQDVTSRVKPSSFTPFGAKPSAVSMGTGSSYLESVKAASASGPVPSSYDPGSSSTYGSGSSSSYGAGSSMTSVPGSSSSYDPGSSSSYGSGSSSSYGPSSSSSYGPGSSSSYDPGSSYGPGSSSSYGAGSSSYGSLTSYRSGSSSDVDSVRAFSVNGPSPNGAPAFGIPPPNGSSGWTGQPNGAGINGNYIDDDFDDNYGPDPNGSYLSGLGGSMDNTRGAPSQKIVAGNTGSYLDNL
jgi:hypothetical protein